MNEQSRTYENCARLRDKCVEAGAMDIVRGCYALNVCGFKWRIFRPEKIVYRLMQDDALYGHLLSICMQRAA